MNKLLVIIGLVVLSGTNAQAANLKSENTEIHSVETLSFVGRNMTQQLGLTKTGTLFMPVSNALSSKICPSLTENDPPPDRGSPDSRGSGSR